MKSIFFSDILIAIEFWHHMIIESLARFTRAFHPPGTTRLLRFLYPPERSPDFEAVIPYDRNLRIVANPASLIEWRIFFFGYYNEELDVAIKKYTRPGGVFVDVGANIGLHSLIAAKVAGEVIAIEPVAEIRERLLRNCQLNTITNITLVDAAISDAAHSVPFYEPQREFHNYGDASLQAKNPDLASRLVTTQRLDDILAGRHIDFIKIDTQGNEGLALLGAKETIRSSRPVVIFDYDEAWWQATGVTLNHIRPLFQDYEIKKIGSDSMLCLPR